MHAGEGNTRTICHDITCKKRRGKRRGNSLIHNILNRQQYNGELLQITNLVKLSQG